MEIDDCFIDLKLDMKNEDDMKLFNLQDEDIEEWPENVSNLRGQISRKKPNLRSITHDPDEENDQKLGNNGELVENMPFFLTSQYQEILIEKNV